MDVRIWSRLLPGIALAIVALLAAAGTAMAARTYVSLTFDDGLLTQYAHRDVLADHGVAGTYYVNTGKVGQPGYMSWQQLRALQAAGNEIGGHTRDHRALPTLSDADKVTQVCDDRDALLANGFDARNFAYPHGAFDAASRAVVAGCGYDTARTTGGLDFPPDCCEYAERLRPASPTSVRAVEPRLTTALSDYRDVIERARDTSGGWIAIVFHDLCSGSCAGADSYAVNTATLAALLDWIEQDPQLRVRTTAQVLAIGADQTPPSAALTAPADGARALTGSAVALAAEASDAVAVERVEFLVDGEVVATDATAPYAAEWQAPDEEADHVVRVRAIDEAGNAGLSEPRTLTVEHDHVAPLVELVDPASDLTVRDGTELTLLAEASDAVGVTRVDFYADGQLLVSDDEEPYAADWTAPEQEGPVALTAKAYDAFGNEGVSAVRTVTVEHDHLAPQVALTAPADGAELLFGGELELRADASDDSAVARVDFYAGDELVASDDEEPFAADWTAPAVAGPVALTARAYDARGNEAVSAARTVVVAAPPPDPPDPPVIDPPPPVVTVDPPPPIVTVDPPRVDRPHDPSAVPERRPRARIVRTRRLADGAVVVRVALRDAAAARQLRLLVDGRVVRVVRRPRATVAFTIRPRAGTRALRVETLDAAGARHRSAPLRLRVSARASVR